jgi:hypothetical protein
MKKVWNTIKSHFTCFVTCQYCQLRIFFLVLER